MLYISTRQRFRPGDPAWEKYVAWIDLPDLQEVISMDAMLSTCVESCGNLLCDGKTVAPALAMLPRPKAAEQFYLAATRLEEPPPELLELGFRDVGCDLCDETLTSSILNCGPWSGELEPYRARLNRCGLLSRADARRVQELLPQAWGSGEPHAFVDIWSLFVAEAEVES
jgi:hypothetical protein